MTTPINIVSLNQGKMLYKDWTLVVVDDSPKPSIFAKLAALWARLPNLPAVSGAGLDTHLMVPGE
jgi:hypothetical protein